VSKRSEGRATGPSVLALALEGAGQLRVHRNKIG
jgi:hypothetical protein